MMGRRILVFVLAGLMGVLLIAGAVVMLWPQLAPESTAQDKGGSSNQQSSGKAPLQEHDSSAVPDQYIVVLNDDVRDPTAVAQEHARRYGATVLQTYQYALKGYAARIPAQRLDDVRSDPQVQFISEDREVQAFQLASGDSNPTGIRRIEAGTTSAAHKASDVGVAVIETR